MAKAIRTKPSKPNRATVKELATKGILMGSMTGMYNVIRAETGEVEEQGFDLWHLHQTRERLPNFYAGLFQCGAWVGYNDGRAKINATTGVSYWKDRFGRSSPPFPANDLASQLIGQPDKRGGFGFPADGMLYGDAILITDIRRHWRLCRREAEQGEIEFFNEMLSTPRTLIERGEGHPPEIFFYEEPKQDDLIFMKFRFG